MSELFEELPEVGDPEKPKLVFFFDEAHLLFNDAPKALLEKIEQVVRLIRSKGVGVYFVTQNPLDVPDKVLAQLGNRVQHALRAFTPRDQKAVRAAAETFRANPKLDTATVISELGKGEALVSFLEGNGTPSMVERCMVRPPSARLGTISPDERKALMMKSPVKGKYDQAVDSESAYEVLQQRTQETAAPAPRGQPGGATPEAPAGTGWWPARRYRGDARLDFRHQPAARPAPVHGSDHHARNHPVGHQPRGGQDRGRSSASRSAAPWADRLAARSCVAPSAAFCGGEFAQCDESIDTSVSAAETCRIDTRRPVALIPIFPEPRMTSAAKVLPAVLARIDADLDKSLDRLFELVRIPSISTDSAYKDFCRAAADHVAKDLESLGFEADGAPDRGSSGGRRQEQRRRR